MKNQLIAKYQLFGLAIFGLVSLTNCSENKDMDTFLFGKKIDTLTYKTFPELAANKTLPKFYSTGIPFAPSYDKKDHKILISYRDSVQGKNWHFVKLDVQGKTTDSLSITNINNIGVLQDQIIANNQRFTWMTDGHKAGHDILAEHYTDQDSTKVKNVVQNIQTRKLNFVIWKTVVMPTVSKNAEIKRSPVETIVSLYYSDLDEIKSIIFRTKNKTYDPRHFFGLNIHNNIQNQQLSTRFNAIPQSRDDKDLYMDNFYAYKFVSAPNKMFSNNDQKVYGDHYLGSLFLTLKTHHENLQIKVNNAYLLKDQRAEPFTNFYYLDVHDFNFYLLRPRNNTYYLIRK